MSQKFYDEYVLKKEHLNKDKIKELVGYIPLVLAVGKYKNIDIEFELVNKNGIMYYDPWHINKDNGYEYVSDGCNVLDCYLYLDGLDVKQGRFLSNDDVDRLLERCTNVSFRDRSYKRSNFEYIISHFNKYVKEYSIGEYDDMKKGTCPPHGIYG